jgi:hypothetical protein
VQVVEPARGTGHGLQLVNRFGEVDVRCLKQEIVRSDGRLAMREW